MMILQFLLKYFMSHFSLPNFLKNAVILRESFLIYHGLENKFELIGCFHGPEWLF